ncbi:hypothetical protein PRIPAC_93449 [Pristionchus pacificus]|uniref:Uncharacterized protein n=1 Tax=Pristionchus pacificus TaxID=54126 RepID=A0A2A6BBG2_PRIPA|nr:hypothetical protein PRIPAC_93449 [Pristionchus pacificus]|eukprot:PDM63194.1 hypothetical protein PRIPAC_50409 [Pristionchus pacificus]
MSSNGVAAPTADDNILAKKAMIDANIKTIRDKKEKILATLKHLGKDEEPNKELMGQLVAAYDSISAQENDYLGILTNIAEIQNRATEDVANDRKELIEKMGKTGANGENEDDTEEDPEEIKKEIQSTLREIAEMHAATLAASMVNEQLVAKLNMNKSKHNAIKQARDDATAVQSETARIVLEEREKAMRKVASERQSMEKKKKELEKLRKTVVKKECEGGEDGEEIEVDESARIPPLRSKEEEEEEERKKKQAEEEREKTLEEKRAEIRARVDAERKRREGAAQQIREKLAAMEKRKERMGEIRRILSGISQAKSEDDAKNDEEKEPENEEKDEKKAVETTRKEIELNLAEASMSLKHLTQLREKLEAMQASGEAPTDEDEELLKRLDETEKIGEEFEHCCPACGRQMESPVASRKRTLPRHPFSSLPPSPLSLPPVPLSFHPQLSSMDTISREGKDGQLTRIEEALAAQRTQLTILVRRGDREDEHTMSRQLHSLLLSSSPRVLSSLSSICLDLSRGKAVPSLERVLETLLDPHDLTVSSLSSVDDLVYENRTTQEASSSTEEMRNRREDEKMQNGVREEKEERETLTVESVVEAIQQQCIDVIEGEESIDDRVKERLLETVLSVLSSLPLSRSFLLQSSSLIDASISPFLSLSLPEYSLPLLEDISHTITSHLELANFLTAIPSSP